MDGEVIENQMADRFEDGSFDPTVVPVDVAVHCVDRPQQARADRLANITEVRRPTRVLIYGQPHAHLIGQVGQPLAHIQIEHERLLAEHVLSRAQSVFNNRRPLRRMRRNVHYFNVVASQQLSVVVGRACIGIVLVAPHFRAGNVNVAQRRDVVSGLLVRREMPLGNSATTDDADVRAGTAWGREADTAKQAQPPCGSLTTFT